MLEYHTIRIKAIDSNSRDPVKKLGKAIRIGIAMNDDDWRKSEGPACPGCGKPTLRFIGRLCQDCSHGLLDELAEKLNKIGLPSHIEDYTVKAVLFDHEIELSFSPYQSVLYYHPARQAERKLFQGLEKDLKRWAEQKGLSFATREGVDSAEP